MPDARKACRAILAALYALRCRRSQAIAAHHVACRLQIHDVTREVPMAIAARIWDEKGLVENPEREADQFLLVRQRFPRPEVVEGSGSPHTEETSSAARAAVAEPPSTHR